jgi:tight adherence protein C
MSWFPIIENETSMLIGFTAVNIAIVGAVAAVWRSFAARDRLAQRVGFASQGLVRPATKARGTARRSPAASHLTGRVLPKGDALEIARRFERFGVPIDYAPAIFNLLRVGAALVLALVLAGVAVHYGIRLGPMQYAAIAACGGLVGWFVPQVIVERLVAKRMQAIERGLPDAIELLVISVEAGLALEDGIDRIVPELRLSQPVLAEELALTSSDLKILPGRDIALRRLSERVTVASVHSIVSTLTQTMRYGTPLAQALRVVASELRNDALIRLEERANKAPALLTVPMIVFILPAVFMIIGGPTALRLIDTFFHASAPIVPVPM